MPLFWTGVIGDVLHSFANVNVKSTRIIMDVGNHHLGISVIDRLKACVV